MDKAKIIISVQKRKSWSKKALSQMVNRARDTPIDLNNKRKGHKHFRMQGPKMRPCSSLKVRFPQSHIELWCVERFGTICAI